MASDDTAANEDWLAKGRAIQTQLWGEQVGSGGRLPAAELAPDFFPLVTQFAFGMFWSRPELPVRDRSLITVAMLAALGRHDELRGHLMGARNLGNPEGAARRGPHAGRGLRRRPRGRVRARGRHAGARGLTSPCGG